MNIFHNRQRSANFWDGEFRCKGRDCCGGAAPIDQRLIDLLQQVRDIIGIPLRINSGFRCLSHNATVGSSITSQHPLGTAADVSADLRPDMISDAVLRVIAPLTYGHVILYPTFVHVDTRDKR